MQASSGGEGGRKWRPEGGGAIIRAIWEDQRHSESLRLRREQDPRQDLLINVGLLLGKAERRSIGPESGPLTLGRYPEDGGMCYFVEDARGQVLFSAWVCTKGVEYTAHLPGSWEQVLHTWMERVREGRLPSPPKPRRRKRASACVGVAGPGYGPERGSGEGEGAC